ncbi:MAG: hypothetical protein LBR11_06835 [Deltaproteobacteria bacterium]|jgi:hypothetical protein|nr:hypothetical protein [Deltaproteobacteria bacterium]
MFNRLAAISGAGERPEIFSLLMVSLGLMAHIMALLGLALGAMALTTRSLGWALGPLESIVFLAVAAGLPRWPVILARSQARRAFGLDNRSLGQRWRAILARELAWFLGLVTVSYVLLISLRGISLGWWAGCLFLAAQLVVWLPWIWASLEPRFFPQRFRPVEPREIPDNLVSILRSLPSSPGWSLQGFRVYLGQTSLPPWPWVAGRDLIIPEKALTMPPGALKHRLVMATLGRLVKAESLTLILRALIMSLTAPLALVFLGSLGLLWRFPLEFSPVLVPCLWLAAGLSYFLAQIMERLTRRLLERKLATAAVLATWDVPGFQASLEVASRYDLEPSDSPWWFWLSRTRPGAIELIERVKSQLQALNKRQAPTPTALARREAFEARDREGAQV